MDCLFNLQIPRSTETCVVIRPTGKTFITGVASSYGALYDKKVLGPYMDEKEFDYIVAHMNDTIHAYWPCSLSIWIGYILSPVTLGFSFMLPNLCIKDAKQALISACARQNRLRLEEKGLHIEYIQGFSTSWLELKVVKKKIEADMAPIDQA